MVERPIVVALAASLLTSLPAAEARAGVELSVRAGATTLELGSAERTPMVGDQISSAVDAYNHAAVAYNQSHGYTSGTPDAAPMTSTADLGLAARLFAVTPAVDVSVGPLRARLEVPVSYGPGLSTAGLGFYPVGVAFAPRDWAVVPFVLAGAAASYVVAGELRGALLEARVVGGVRLAGRVSLEIGYRPYVVGGAIDRGRLDSMSAGYDPAGAEAPAHPASVVRGGVGQALDVTLGVSL